MTSLIQGIKRYRLLLIFSVLVLVVMKGCELFPEASFELATDSRLPRWVTLPTGLSRANTSLRLDYYAVPWRRARFLLQESNGHTLKRENGDMRCKAPFEAKNPSKGFPPGYPAYEAITVRGTTEIIEHRKMEPIFYVTDDPTVWEQYRSMGC